MAGVMCEPLEKRARLEDIDYDDSSSCHSIESRYTWQGYETAWVKDSGDDWSPSSSEVESGDDENENVVYEVEYELASDVTNLESSDTDDSSDVEAAILPIIAAAACELDDDSLAGSDSSDDGIIRVSPLPIPKMQNDRWKCLRCGVLNVPPMRYCSKCYEIRKGWLDPRPKRRKAKKRRNSSYGCDTTDGVPSTSSSTSSTVCLTDDKMSSSMMSVVEEPTQSSNNSSLCGLCVLCPSDGVFVHGNTGHQLYCYSCSKRVWRQRKQCPICRRTIAKVIKLFKTV